MEQEQNKDENTQANKYSASKRYTGVYLSNIVAVPNVNITCEIGNPEELNNIRLAHERGDQVVLLSSRDGKFFLRLVAFAQSKNLKSKMTTPKFCCLVNVVCWLQKSRHLCPSLCFMRKSWQK